MNFRKGEKTRNPPRRASNFEQIPEKKNNNNFCVRAERGRVRESRRWLIRKNKLDHSPANDGNTEGKRMKWRDEKEELLNCFKTHWQ